MSGLKLRKMNSHSIFGHSFYKKLCEKFDKLTYFTLCFHRFVCSTQSGTGKRERHARLVGELTKNATPNSKRVSVNAANNDFSEQAI